MTKFLFVIPTNTIKLLLISAEGINLKKTVLTKIQRDGMAIISLLYLYASSAQLQFRISRNLPWLIFVPWSQRRACIPNLSCAFLHHIFFSTFALPMKWLLIILQSLGSYLALLQSSCSESSNTQAWNTVPPFFNMCCYLAFCSLYHREYSSRQAVRSTFSPWRTGSSFGRKYTHCIQWSLHWKGFINKTLRVNSQTVNGK